MIVYAATPGPRREPSLAAFEAIAEGRAVGLTSAAVLEEVWHLELSDQVEGLAGQAERAHAILRPVLAIDDEVLAIAFDLSPRGGATLGANDRLHAATCIRHGIETILSADRGFDSVRELTRVDPLDAHARDDLW